MGRTKQLTHMVHELEAVAYKRGFNDGVRAALKAVKSLRPNGRHAGEDVNGVEVRSPTRSSVA